MRGKSTKKIPYPSRYRLFHRNPIAQRSSSLCLSRTFRPRTYNLITYRLCVCACVLINANWSRLYLALSLSPPPPALTRFPVQLKDHLLKSKADFYPKLACRWLGFISMTYLHEQKSSSRTIPACWRKPPPTVQLTTFSHPLVRMQVVAAVGNDRLAF